MGEREKRAFANYLKTAEIPASAMRENVSRAVRESRVFKDKLKPIEPVDYETYILQKRGAINNDALRSMVMFPYDDVSASTIPRQLRTTRSTVPGNAVKEASSLFVKECINSYTTEWKVINNKYNSYAGSFTELPQSRLTKTDQLPEQRYEVDESDESKSEDSLLSPSGQNIKSGFLYKTPFGSRSENIFMKSYKRRFFYLKQLADKSFLLEYHKDERSAAAKGHVYLDSLLDVIKSSKHRKYGLELKMQDKTWYNIAAESESEMQDWYNTLKQVLEQQKADANADKQSISSMDDLDTQEYADESMSSPEKTESFLSGLEKSKHPELQKYAKENERTNAQRRKENRLNPFILYPRMMIGNKSSHGPDSKPYEEEFGKRIVVEFQELKFRLAAAINSHGEPVEGTEQNPAHNIEPFFTSLALYDAKNNKKISEDLFIDINHKDVKAYLDKFKDIPNGSGSPKEKERKFSTLPDVSDLDEEWLKYPNKGIFSVRQPNPDIYLVVRIDKILQGNIAACTEPYLKTGDIIKSCQKVVKSAKVYCSRVTQYRMPFAWTARRVFTDGRDLDLKAAFSPIYRQESSKLTNDDLLKMLQDLRRNPEKLSKLTEIPGTIKVSVEPFTRMLPNCLTSSLVPTMPWPSTPSEPPILEVEEFTPENGNVAHPYTSYTNNLYVYPINLKYDSQKAYTKARNIAVCVEFRDSDDLDAKPVRSIYGRPGTSIFTSMASVPVLHHSQSPDFYEEIKIAIPTQVTDKHHLLFRFYHVSCEMGKGTVKKKDTVDSFVGYAWLPLLDQGRINSGELAVGVSSSLPAGYLKAKSMGLGKTIGPDVKWVDGGKPLLKVRLKLLSTVYTESSHLHNFFATCESWDGSGTNALDVIQSVKAMHAVETHRLIEFLPVILNQLFRLLPITLMDEVQLNVVRLIIFIVTQVHNVDRSDVLHSYVKYVFETERESEHKKTIHEELVKNLAVSLRSIHDAQVIKNLLKHLWFFFAVLTKSMSQTLIMQDKLKAPRHSRFSTQFENGLRNLVTYLMPIILKKYNEHSIEAKEANSHLAKFIKSCFTYMDRGFVFRLINCYLDHFDPNDPKPFFEMKFDLLRIVCNHEHYIALNLPLQKKNQQPGRPIKAPLNIPNIRRYQALLRSTRDQYKDLNFLYQLTEEFCQNHFLTGLLLREVGMALHDVTEVRQHGIKVLRNLLAKHSLDDRYLSKQHQSRIAILYLPLLSIILENASRMVKEQGVTTPGSTLSNSDTSFDSAFERHHSMVETPTDSRPNNVAYSQKTRSLQRDSTVLDIIAGKGSTPDVVLRSGSRKSNSPNRLSWSSSNSGEVVLRGGSKNRNSAHRLSWTSGTATPMISTPRPIEDKDRTGSIGSLSSTTSDGKATMNGLGEGDKADGSTPKGHTRNKSTIMYDKLLDHEIKDLLVCFLYVIKNVTEEVLLGFWSRAPEDEQVQFFEVLELCLRHFQYLGKKQITALKLREKPSGNSEERSKTMPVSKSRAMQTRSLMIGDLPLVAALSESEASHRIQQEANMANEIGLIVLDVLGLYCTHFKNLLDGEDGDNPLMRKVLDIFLSYLQLGQSETLQKHAFASLRAFANKFPVALFKGSATLCADICLAMLKCLNSRLASTRSEACALLYLLMRHNFEFTQRKEFIRVHLQVIISVSKLIGEANSARFQESLALVNNYANSDRSMQHTSFPSQVKDLTKKIRTVLMATAQMKEHENDPEMLVDLQYSLAKSYASTPELRRTWLDSMAKIHITHGNYSEAAHCWIHIAALIAEYLRRNKGKYPQGCSAFKNISPNIEPEEKGMKDDTGMQDVQYSEETLIEQLEACTEGLQKAERYETMGEVYKLLIPFYEKNRNFLKLAIAYGKLSEAYKTVMQVQHTGRRLLGEYFRVAFFGQHFEEDDGKEYIYKEPKATPLSDICHRLLKLYQEKYGADVVKLFMDSKKVNAEDLDSSLAHIQITYVKPYFDDKELESRKTSYERRNNIRRFVYETPYTKNGKARAEKVEEQYKRKTIVTTAQAFPYVKKRIQVVYVQQQELNPIQVAIDELKAKVNEMKDVLMVNKPDMKRLQLLLQGSVSVTVNAGPQAYAAAFMGKDCEQKWKSQLVWELKQLFREFVQVCGQSLEVNAKLIKSDQHEYHDDLVLNYKSMVANLSQLMQEKISEDETWQITRRASGHIFNAISGTP